MKLTPEDILNEEVPAGAEKPKREKPLKKRSGRRKEKEEDNSENVIEPSEDVNEPSNESDGEENVSKKFSKLKALVIVAFIGVGFLLFAINAKSIVDGMRMDKAAYQAEHDPSYQEALNDFETPDTESSVKADGTEESTQVERLQAEIERLEKEAADAKNSEATMEQELNNAKALLDASTAREAQLRSELESLSSGGK